jgi:hypothetical protein
MKITPNILSNQGFLQFDLEEEQLLPIKKEIDKIQNNFDGSIESNYGLAGHIDKEYELFDCRSHIEESIVPNLTEQYVINFGMPGYCNNILSSNVPYVICEGETWVNFQKKYEFNPIHNHSGVFSFVIWIQIPYDIDEEKKVYTKINNYNRTSSFEFIYSDIYGMINTHMINVDKSYEGKGLFFPSMLNHCVYPFYTSDRYRISVSGNIKFKVSK